MGRDASDIRFLIDTPDRRSLLARLCAELARALARDERWERDDTVVPWHASAQTFETLPGRVVTAILAEWEETGAGLAGVEFSGYLETDNGPRAWGCLMVRAGRPRAQRPELTACAVERVGDGYRLEAWLRPGVQAAEKDDG